MTASATTLRLGGLTPMTTTDYPGELAATLFCQGCPWRCPYCHNAHLLATAKGPALDWSKAVDFLKGRRGLLDAVVFSGGEPTAQAALAAAITEVRALGYRIGLHTGGPYPRRLARVLPQLDWIGLDIKALPEDYARVTGVPGSGAKAWQSLELVLEAQQESNLALEVRTTPLPGLDTPDYLARLMQALARTGVRRYALQACRAHSLLDDDLCARQPLRLETPAEIPFPHFALR
jgi:pyruvate formate lyase activating enzyme